MDKDNLTNALTGADAQKAYKQAYSTAGVNTPIAGTSISQSGYAGILGNVTTVPWSNTYQPNQWPNYGIYSYTAPTHCSGETHLFACKHEPKCKCGKVQRVDPVCGCGR